MTKEQLAEFLSQVQENTNLQNQLRSADNVDDVLRITKASGFAIDPYESTNTQAELSQVELEGAAGGATGCVIFCHTQPNVCQ